MLGYATNIVELELRRDVRGDKSLEGVGTTTLSEEQMRKFEFVVNPKAAEQSGLTTPPNVPARANQLIK